MVKTEPVAGITKVSILTKTYLRRADRDDLDQLVRWMEDEDFQYFLYGDPARSPRLIREQIISYLGKSAGSAIPSSIYFIVDSPQGPLGMIALQNISWRNRCCNIDVYIAPEHRGTIIVGINVLRALEYAFDELNMHRVTAVIYAFNTSSWRLFEYIGAVREVTLRDQVTRDGTWYDVYMYGILKPEFDRWREQYKDKRQLVNLEQMIQDLRRKIEET